MQEYLAIAQDRMHVEHHVRQADGSWLLREYCAPDEVLQVPSIRCRLTLAEIYRKVKQPEITVSKPPAGKRARRVSARSRRRGE